MELSPGGTELSSTATHVKFVGIAGASGSGKTTLATILAGAFNSPFEPVQLDYFFDESKCQDYRSWEMPEAIDYKLLCKQLQEAKEAIEEAVERDADTGWLSRRCSTAHGIRCRVADAPLAHCIYDHQRSSAPTPFTPVPLNYLPGGEQPSEANLDDEDNEEGKDSLLDSPEPQEDGGAAVGEGNDNGRSGGQYGSQQPANGYTNTAGASFGQSFGSNSHLSESEDNAWPRGSSRRRRQSPGAGPFRSSSLSQPPKLIIIVVEGFLLLHDEAVTSLLDAVITIEAQPERCSAQRFLRMHGGATFGSNAMDEDAIVDSMLQEALRQRPDALDGVPELDSAVFEECLAGIRERDEGKGNGKKNDSPAEEAQASNSDASLRESYGRFRKWYFADVWWHYQQYWEVQLRNAATKGNLAFSQKNSSSLVEYETWGSALAAVVAATLAVKTATTLGS